jgi:1,5-anhydro-D-fructose reductase (1,5-anhydro-D-mannitol-forming)
MSSTINIGVVGCARIFPAHLRGLKELRDHGFNNFRITALCDAREEDALRFRKRGEGPPPRPSVITHAVHDPLNVPHMYVSDLHPDTIPDVYTDWRDMLRSARIDAVLVLTPVFLHHQVTLDSLRAGKHVLFEKPMAISVRAGGRMVEEARARGLSLGIAEVVRYLEGVRAAKFAIDAGVIGDIQMWIAGGMGSLDWSPDRIISKTAWRHKKLEAGGGPALDGAVHRFHEIRYLCGEVDEISALAPRFEPVRVTKDDAGQITDTVKNEVEDAYFAQFRLRGGAVGILFGGPAGHGEPTSMGEGPVIYGTKGCLKLIRVFPHVVDGTVILDGGHRSSAVERFGDAPAELKERWFPRGIKDGFALEALDFLRSIETGTPMESSGDEGLRDLTCAFAILESATVNRPVRIADVTLGQVRAYQREIDEHYGL